MNFFVIGLPRSRTAWLANFLTYENKFCHHEGMSDCRNIDEYKTKLGTNDGDSSTGLMLFNMNVEFPKAPKIIIESPIEKSVEYAYKTYGYYDPSYIRHLKMRMDEIAGMRINVDQIDEKLPLIWAHLIGTPYDKKRGELLKQLRIEIKDPQRFDKETLAELWNSLD